MNSYQKPLAHRIFLATEGSFVIQHPLYDSDPVQRYLCIAACIFENDDYNQFQEDNNKIQNSATLISSSVKFHTVGSVIDKVSLYIKDEKESFYDIAFSSILTPISEWLKYNNGQAEIYYPTQEIQGPRRDVIKKRVKDGFNFGSYWIPG